MNLRKFLAKRGTARKLVNLKKIRYSTPKPKQKRSINILGSKGVFIK